MNFIIEEKGIGNKPLHDHGLKRSFYQSVFSLSFLFLIHIVLILFVNLNHLNINQKLLNKIFSLMYSICIQN